ncbi:membrane protein [Youhaiella tibetensis]|uniref:DsbA family protein n=1 Tax=Paradevosia tibetensis TaxID=1447062 RepID=A0A5B9DR39_9HYPH|nr:DsbA family protein [Youhaiella tibetensis]QEE20844.1 DsbA family protein [Youhaiella tibetensis]GGF20493.1 membrane protein [Youhaiella tibetensis]
MSRLTIALVALAGILAGGLAVSLYKQPQALDTAQVRSVVEDVLKERADAAPVPVETAAIDQDKLNPMIESYLLGNPRILQRVSEALDTQLRAEQRDKAKSLIAQMSDAIYNDPDHVVLGNPNGDVTLVEMFDYNCGYCRNALPDLATLLAEDPNLKVILKEFPILSKESVDAARVAVLVGKDKDVDYWTFHQALFTSRGKVTAETALDEAQKLGMSKVDLALKMGSEEVSTAIENTYRLAKALNITGTPTYIIGNELIPGAIGLDELRGRISNVRACGETVCTSG